MMGALYNTQSFQKACKIHRKRELTAWDMIHYNIITAFCKVKLSYTIPQTHVQKLKDIYGFRSYKKSQAGSRFA